MSAEILEILENELPGPVLPGPIPSEDHIAAWRGRVPDLVIELWQRHGFAGYGNGRLWLTDPDEWAPTVALLVERVGIDGWPGGSTPVALARSGFGAIQLLLPGQGLGVIDVGLGLSRFSPSADGDDLNVESLFAMVETDDWDMVDESGEAMFDRAVDRLGPLTDNEVYALVPTLAMGGSSEVGNLHKLEVHANLEVVSELMG